MTDDEMIKAFDRAGKPGLTITVAMLEEARDILLGNVQVGFVIDEATDFDPRLWERLRPIDVEFTSESEEIPVALLP